MHGSDLGAARRRAFGRFVLVATLGNLLWETAHVRLYTLWETGSRAEITYAVLHCTLGDGLIAAFSLLLAVALFGRGAWPSRASGRVALATILFALAYTVFSEWLNVEVRESWAYLPAMPRLPLLGTGLSPLIQWLVIPALAFLVLLKTPPRRS